MKVFPGCFLGCLTWSIWMFPKKGILPPKWMGKIMVPNPMNKWDDLGGFTPIFGLTPI